MLTRKQAELLRFIHERLKEAGVPPSFDEMKDALDLRSKSGIHRLITALEERGFIRRLPNRARAISCRATLRHPGRFGGFKIMPVFGFKGPGAHMPIAFTSPVMLSSIAPQTWRMETSYP